ncbi:hypothetical protein KP509_1Z084200 [Ceratopteris richardii]|nr:hypothetical protein KP509_1Z084200 [Ceratopteris richardii]
MANKGKVFQVSENQFSPRGLTIAQGLHKPLNCQLVSQSHDIQNT